MKIIPGKIFHEMDDDFWDYGPGAMHWSTVNDRLVLWVVLPNNPPFFSQLMLLYPRNNGSDWTQPGDVEGWNGDLESPTFHPSISVPNLGWHGWIREGDLHTII